MGAPKNLVLDTGPDPSPILGPLLAIFEEENWIKKKYFAKVDQRIQKNKIALLPDLAAILDGDQVPPYLQDWYIFLFLLLRIMMYSSQ